MIGIHKFTAGTGMANVPSVRLLESLGFCRVGTERVSFYKDAGGRDIYFEGGLFELRTDEDKL
jgi:RimJ/RimL family protein N-acetyltransferase